MRKYRSFVIIIIDKEHLSGETGYKSGQSEILFKQCCHIYQLLCRSINFPSVYLSTNVSLKSTYLKKMCLLFSYYFWYVNVNDKIVFITKLITSLKNSTPRVGNTVFKSFLSFCAGNTGSRFY